MRQPTRFWTAALLCGLLALCLGLATAEEPVRDVQTAGDDVLAQAASVGVAAATLQAAATASGVSPAALVHTLRNNEDAHLTSGGIHFGCSFGHRHAVPEEWRQTSRASLSGDGEVRAANLPASQDHNRVYSTDDAFRLHSRPAAQRKIYLAFEGCVTQSVFWNRPELSILNTDPIVTPPFDFNGDTTTFSTAERREIMEMWRIVAEDFALWDVDITTEQPTDDQLRRFDDLDQEFGQRVCIGGRSDAWYRQWDFTGGTAPYNSFGQPTIFGDAFVFPQIATTCCGTVEPPVQVLAAIISHEVGHTVGLSHDGYRFTAADGSERRNEYAPGIPAWAPIMGSVTYVANANPDTSRGFVQWSDMRAYPPTPGYLGPTNTEDDIAIISRLLPPLLDEDGNTRANAALLPTGLLAPASPPIQLSCPDDPDEFERVCSQPNTNAPTIVRRGYNAVINSANDFDFYSFTARSAGNVTIWLDVVDLFDNNGNTYHRTNLRLNMDFSDARVRVFRAPVDFRTTTFRVTAVLPQELDYPAAFTFYVAPDFTNLGPGYDQQTGNGIPSGYGTVGDYSVFVDFPGRDPPPPPPPACQDPDICSVNGACNNCECTSDDDPCVCAADEGFVARRDNQGPFCAWNLGNTIQGRVWRVRPNSRVRLPWRLGAGICNDRRVVRTVRISNTLVACPATQNLPSRLSTAPRGEAALTEGCGNNRVSYTSFNVGNLSTTRTANRRCRRVTVTTTDDLSHTFFLWVTQD